MKSEISVDVLKQAISYYYLLSYCPVNQVADFQTITKGLRNEMAGRTGLSEDAFFQAVLPEVFQRIVIFHMDSREPDQDLVQALVSAAKKAGKSIQNLGAFQSQMAEVAGLKPRAHPENRLHRSKGCAFCQAPCLFGYFSLVSNPDFRELNRMFQEEKQRPKTEQNPQRPVLGFTLSHLARVSKSNRGLIQRSHLGNLAFCLLLLSMAKSRMALPEKELQAFQERMQAWIKAG